MSALRTRLITVFLLCAGGLLIAPTHAGTPMDLDSLRGHVVYLDLWASWCAPCRQSFPWMQVMKQTYERQGLSVIAINLDHDRTDAERFLQRYHPDFVVQFDPQGTFAERFQVAGMPTSVLIDRHGITRFRHIGFRPVDREAYEQEVRALLAEK
jgi:cytochrome c biogenesis protein CcmG, thiol:disulfide interchange protein DsbE